MKKRFCIGDIHGAHKALLQCFERSSFNPEKDQLISLGDVADGWSEVPMCFEELRKVKDLIYIMGNHDEWLLHWFKTGESPPIWLTQGGEASVNAYMTYLPRDMNKVHEKLLDKAVYYHEVDDMLFIHGGFNWHYPIEDQEPYDLTWDRHLWAIAQYWDKQKYNKDLSKVKDYDEVFIGHTTTSRLDPELKPVHASNVWNLDQGAGWEGKLTIMDIDTKEYWQSDIVADLYPEIKGRR